MKIRKIYLAITAVWFLEAGVVVAQREEEKSSARAEATAQRKQANIKAEIQKLGDHEWAGEYYAGDGLGVNTTLILAPKSGYVFEWHGCLGLYDRNYGSVAWTNGRIRLDFTFENQRKALQGVAPEFIPIAWGSRRYLIPSDDLVGFCNNINERQEPRNGIQGFHFLRRGDEKRKVTGFPKVPDEYRQYLLAKPIEARIIAVGPYTTRPSVVDWKFKDTPVTLDAGEKEGLRVGMELVVTRPRDTVESVRITKVAETRSEAIMSQTGEEEPGPAVGWRLSTQAPWSVRKTK